MHCIKMKNVPQSTSENKNIIPYWPLFKDLTGPLGQNDFEIFVQRAD